MSVSAGKTKEQVLLVRLNQANIINHYLRERDGMKTTVQEVETTVEAIRKTNRDIRNYHWMANLITKTDVEEFMPSPVAMGGIESTMPKAPYSVGDPTYGAVQKKI